MTFDDLEHCVHEGIIAMTDDPAVISAEVTALLNGIAEPLKAPALLAKIDTALAELP
jgi:hypothetical protein